MRFTLCGHATCGHAECGGTKHGCTRHAWTSLGVTNTRPASPVQAQHLGRRPSLERAAGGRSGASPSAVSLIEPPHSPRWAISPSRMLPVSTRPPRRRRRTARSATAIRCPGDRRSRARSARPDGLRTDRTAQTIVPRDVDPPLELPSDDGRPLGHVGSLRSGSCAAGLRDLGRRPGLR